MRFLGAYDYTLDDRGRVPMPPPFRPALKGNLYITAGTDECIHVYPEEEFERQAAIYDALPEGDQVVDNARRDFFGSFKIAELDGQGRINVPVELAERAGIGRDATGRDVKVVGVSRRIEIWSKAVYDAREDERKRARAQLAASGFAPARSPAQGGA
jgi:MraZ protein